jgi:predicted  nucleic acid-binding Zn-ribbon protein
VREHGARLQDFYKEIEALRGEVETLREDKADLERLVREHGARLQDFYKEIEALRQAKAALEDSLKEHR